MYGKDKLSAYVDADVFVLPSRHEGFPMVLLEAWACGKPVIASRTGGLRELISDGETGILFEPKNHKELAEKILYLLNDPAKAEEIGRKAKLLVERKYSISKIVEQIERVYHDIISSKDHG
jgi:glycosyltransferase involved in cell wall biosynthesis